MLCNEYWMPFHRGLLYIILGERYGHPDGDEINGVGTDGVNALFLNVLVILFR